VKNKTCKKILQFESISSLVSRLNNVSNSTFRILWELLFYRDLHLLHRIKIVIWALPHKQFEPFKCLKRLCIKLLKISKFSIFVKTGSLWKNTPNTCIITPRCGLYHLADIVSKLSLTRSKRRQIARVLFDLQSHHLPWIFDKSHRNGTCVPMDP
jgi:hypothetical protein